MRHVKEFYSQMLFFAICETWLISQSSNLKLTREFNHTTKQLDFRFTISDKNSVCVQVKHANGNGLETCYGKQVTLNDLALSIYPKSYITEKDLIIKDISHLGGFYKTDIAVKKNANIKPILKELILELSDKFFA